MRFATSRHGGAHADREPSLQEYGEFLLKARLVKEKAAPYCVPWARAFLARPASPEPLQDQVRRFCEDIDLLVDEAPENIGRVKLGLGILADNAAADVADSNVRDHTVVRVVDEVIIAPARPSLHRRPRLRGVP